MELFKEYTDLVDLYDKDPTHPQTTNELINICYLPEFYSRFGLNTDKQKLALSSKHLYTMQVAEEVGYYKVSSDTHYHNLRKKMMLKFPTLLLNPDFVFYDQSYNDFKKDSIPSSLVTILPQRFYKINTKTKESEKEVLVAYIEEPNDVNDKTTILTTSFPKHDIERYINRLIQKNRLLYISEDFLNEKKSLSTVYPGIQFPNIATHSNGETRNSMAFLGSFNNNIRQYRENVNLKRMEISGLYLEHIPENEKTKIVCNRAFANNPYAVNYFPEPLREQTYKIKVFETLDKKTIQTIPNELFIPSLQYFLQNTEQCGHQSKIIYNTLKKRLSKTQKDILSQTVNPDKEPGDKEIVRAFESWSEGNLYGKLKASPIPQNIQTISDSIASFEKNDSSVLNIVGKSFEVGQNGIPTFNGLTALSKAMNVYSDKQFETARYLFVKDGTIIRHLAISSNTPSSTIYKQNEDFLSNLASYAKETDSKIVFLHNHPSGLIEPSEADINQTNYLTNYFEQKDGSNLFTGHIILDHGKFGLYTAEDRKWGALIDDKLHSFDEFNRQFTLEVSAFSKGLFNDVQKNYGYTPSVFRNSMLNPDKSVSSQTLLILSEYAKKCDVGEMWNKKDWIPTFFMNENNIVTSLEYTNLIELESIDSFSDKLKMIGRNYGSENVMFFPNTYDQFLSCERYAHLTNKVKEIYYQNPDGTFELSQYNNGNIFNDTKISDITIDDTEQYPEEVKKKIFYEQSVINTRNSVSVNNLKENKTMAKITDEEVSVENPHDNMLAKDAATNYIFEKLSKAGIEVITDKEEFEKIIATNSLLQKMYVDIREFENTQKQIQMLKEQNENIKKDNHSLIREQSFIDFQTSLIACKKFMEDLPEKKLPALQYKTKNENGENIIYPFDIKILNSELVLMIGPNVQYNFETKQTEIERGLEIFKDFNLESDCSKVLIETINNHLGKQLGEQRRVFKQLMEENAVLSGKDLNELSPEETKELKEKLKEQEYENVEGIFVHKDKKNAVTPDVYVSEIQNAKLLVDQNYTVYLLPENFAFRRKNEKGRNESYSTPDTLTNDEFVELKTTNKKIRSRFGDAVEQSNIVLIRIKDDISLYNARKRLQEKINSLPKEKNINVKNGYVFLYFEKKAQFVSAEIKNGKITILPQTPSLSDLTGSRPANINISEKDNLSSIQNMVSNGTIYGFTHEGKIYLNPDVMNSNAAVHEYTHLWDSYTQKTEPELWQKGLTIFKDTNYWKEVLNDPNYQDIKNDENLVLSEIHSRICGKMAEKTLEKITELDGEQVKFDAIDWDNEVNEFIAEEFGIKPELGTENYISDSYKAALLKDFLSSPMKDLFINEKNFEIERENQQDQTESLNQSDSELSDLNKDNPSEIEKEGLHKSFEYDGLTYIPVRSLSKEEKEIINNRTPKEIWENAIIEKPKNGDNYSLNEFIEKAQAETGNENADLFYCIEKGKFFTPVENGIVNLNENSINKHFNAELQKFYNSPDIQNIIKTNRPLVFDKTKDLELTNNLTSVISDGEVFTKKNENLGDIRVKLGNLKHGGINHIIKHRMDKLIQHDGKSYDEAVKETSAILFLAVKNISEAPATKETNGRFVVYKNGIKTVIGKDDNGRYVISGFDFEDTKQEAADFIKSVNALYGYTPEFLEIYAQVGAAYASLSNNINYNNSVVNDSLSNENTRKPEQQSKIEELENKVRSMQTLFEKYQSVMEENAKLRQDIELLKSQQSQSDSQTMGEKGSGSISQSENRNTEAFEMNSFNRDTAYREKTKVPRFGIADDKTGKIEIIEGAVFSGLIENKLDNSKNEVALSILNKDGTHREIIITEQRYNDMINAQRVLEEKKSSVSQDRKYEWELIFENYNKTMMTDENNFRMNTCENFIHNFRIHCKLEANNQEEAIKCAADMVSRMTPVERKRFNLMRKQAGGEVFDRLLMKEFEDISKEKQIKEKDLSFDKNSTNNLLYEANKKYLELEPGEEIEGTEKKVGDSIVFSIKTAGLDGKIRKTPKAEFKIVKVTKNQIPDRAIIFNEKAKAYYTIPLSDLKKHIQKVEKERIKEEKKQIKKDNKRVGYEGQSL